MAVRAVVVDDEALARRRIVRLLKARGDVEIVAECAGGLEALAAIRGTRPDLLFLDVQMPEIDGFEVLRRLEVAPPAVIFVTAYDKYALRAFEASAQDYLLKPYDTARFVKAVDRALQYLHGTEARELQVRLHQLTEELRRLGHASEEPQGSDASDVSRPLQRFVVRDDEKSTVIRADEVDWIESDGNYVWLHVGPVSHLLRATLASCAERLNPRQFARIHRRYIVNVARVKELQPRLTGDYVIVLRDGHKLRLSRSFRGEFQALLRTTG